jgi:hypothetical protein
MVVEVPPAPLTIEVTLFRMAISSYACVMFRTPGVSSEAGKAPDTFFITNRWLALITGINK